MSRHHINLGLSIPESRNQNYSVDIIIMRILKKFNRNKPTFKLGNKTDKFSFLLQDQLQSLCKLNKLFV